MPSAAARRLYEDQIPSFMSVFGDLSSETMDEQGPVAVVDSKIIGFPGSSFAGKLSHPSSSQSHPLHPAVTSSCDLPHRHHDSTSTQASESTDSSPTTTVSCTDSSLSDPSPSSSPDSPVNLVPLAAFPGPSFGVFPSMPNGHNGSGGFNGLASPPAMNQSSLQERPMTSPSPRRARNMKGLSIQPPFASPALASPSIGVPATPSFIKPKIPAMKRKPSQLSLKTSTNDLTKAAAADALPQSPAMALPPILQRRALKHSTSSPHMLSFIKTSTFGPAGGMTFPTVLERNESGLSEFLRPSQQAGPAAPALDSTIVEEESPIRTQVANRAAFEFEPYHENENNEDQKSPGYPDGPIAIYGDNVFLYLEPSAEEASRFDVVINVAREVRNPFKAKADSVVAPQEDQSTPPQQQQQPQQPPQQIGLLPAAPSGVPETIPEQPAEAMDIAEVAQTGPLPAIYETAAPMDTDPTFPEPSSGSTTGHVAIAAPSTTSTLPLRIPTLSLSLADVGTSIPTEPGPGESTPTTPRANSLLKEPEYIHMPWDHHTDIGEDLMSLCETIEKRTREGKKVLIHCQQGASRSASLIIAYGMYQNPDLSVNDSYYAAQAKSRWISPNMRLMYCLQDFQKELVKKKQPPSSSLRPRTGRSPMKHRMTLSADAVDASPTREPLSAPLPAEDSLGGNAKSKSPDKHFARPRGNSTPTSRDAVSPGPASAPSSFSWDIKEDESDRFKFGRFPRLDKPAPVVKPPSLAAPSLKPPPLKPPSLKPISLKPPSPKLALASAPRPPAHLSLNLPGASADGAPAKPPPSPGFAAHRFGGFSNFSRPNPLSLSSFGPRSPGFPPPRSAGNDGLDSILYKSMGPDTHAPAATNGIDTTKPQWPLVNEQSVTVRPAFPVEDALMSPRVETMTNNPLHDPFGSVAGMHFVEAPSTPSEGLFSPRETMFPRDPFSPFARPTQVTDPRSPPTKGEMPIVRSIDELI